MSPALRPASVALALGCAAIACDGGAKPKPRHPAPTSSVTAQPPPEPAGVFASKRFGLRLPLPGGGAWKIDDTTTRWLSAKNAEEASSLLVRLWPDENRMSRDRCEERARSVRKLPVRDGAEIVEERLLDLPPGFDTRADVALIAAPNGELFGLILAFGGLGRRCFAYVYVTQARGPGSDRVVGDRLARMMEGSLAALVFQRDFDVLLERDAPEDAAGPAHGE